MAPTLKQRIQDEMTAQTSQPGQAPIRRRHMDVGCKMEFACNKCSKTWSSAHSCVFFKLAANGTLQSFRAYKQRCRDCQAAGGESSPKFSKRAVRELVTRMLQMARGEKSARGKGQKQGPPHLSNECEKCQWGAKPHQH